MGHQHSPAKTKAFWVVGCLFWRGGRGAVCKMLCSKITRHNIKYCSLINYASYFLCNSKEGFCIMVKVPFSILTSGHIWPKTAISLWNISHLTSFNIFALFYIIYSPFWPIRALPKENPHPWWLWYHMRWPWPGDQNNLSKCWGAGFGKEQAF